VMASAAKVGVIKVIAANKMESNELDRRIVA